MLVLSRNVGEVVCIGDSVTVKVIKIQKGKVRLIIGAPVNVPIRRAELEQKEKKQ